MEGSSVTQLKIIHIYVYRYIPDWVIALEWQQRSDVATLGNMVTQLRTPEIPQTTTALLYWGLQVGSPLCWEKLVSQTVDAYIPHLVLRNMYMWYVWVQNFPLILELYEIPLWFQMKLKIGSKLNQKLVPIEIKNCLCNQIRFDLWASKIEFHCFW